jgi:hypothetical protein
MKASRRASPAHTDSATAAPRTPQQRMTNCVIGYPEALSPRRMAPTVLLITSALQTATPITPSTVPPRRPGTQSPRSHQQRSGAENRRPSNKRQNTALWAVTTAGPLRLESRPERRRRARLSRTGPPRSAISARGGCAGASAPRASATECLALKAGTRAPRSRTSGRCSVVVITITSITSMSGCRVECTRCERTVAEVDRQAWQQVGEVHHETEPGR